MKTKWYISPISVLLLLCLQVVHAADPVIRIASASSMRFVLDELLQVYEANSGESTIDAVYGSSGNLYRQIVQGAPFDLFLSADISLVEKLNDRSEVQRIEYLGYGELVLYSNSDRTKTDLATQFESAVRSGALDGAGFKVAIANPGHAPYGKAAQQALENMGLRGMTEPRLVVADSVSQAAQFARTGAVAFALISKSLATELDGVFITLPGHLHEPVQHSIVLLRNSKPAGRLLQSFKEEAALSVLREYGFSQRRVD